VKATSRMTTRGRSSWRRLVNGRRNLKESSSKLALTIEEGSRNSWFGLPPPVEQPSQRSPKKKVPSKKADSVLFKVARVDDVFPALDPAQENEAKADSDEAAMDAVLAQAKAALSSADSKVAASPNSPVMQSRVSPIQPHAPPPAIAMQDFFARAMAMQSQQFRPSDATPRMSVSNAASNLSRIRGSAESLTTASAYKAAISQAASGTCEPSSRAAQNRHARCEALAAAWLLSQETGEPIQLPPLAI